MRWLTLFLLVGCASTSGGRRSSPPAPSPYRQAVREEITRHANDAQFCYATTFERPAPSGEVLLGFEITADGSVTFAEIEQSDFEGKDFGECMVAMAMRWHFPPPPPPAAALPLHDTFSYLFTGAPE